MNAIQPYLSCMHYLHRSSIESSKIHLQVFYRTVHYTGSSTVFAICLIQMWIAYRNLHHGNERCQGRNSKMTKVDAPEAAGTEADTIVVVIGLR